MEKLSVKIDLLMKKSYIFEILSFYGYAYKSVEVIRGLWKQSRSLWIDKQVMIIRMFIKQTISLTTKIDEKIEVLKRVDRYKLFKFSIQLSYNI